MPIRTLIQEFAVTSSGGNFVIDINTQIPVYIVSGTATMIGNLQITPSAVPVEGTSLTIKWEASLDISTNSTTVLIFGTSLSIYQCLSPQTIYCFYNNGNWIVEVHSSFASNNIISTNHIENDAITTSKIADEAVTDSKLPATGITNIADNAIKTSMLQDLSVINDKINPGPSNSLKVTDNTGVVSDFSLGTDELIIGSVLGLTTILKSDLLTNIPIVFIVPVSFESGEQSINAFYTPVNCVIDTVRCCVTKDIAGTDDASVAITGNDGSSPFLPNLTITQGTVADTVLASAISGGTLPAGTMTYVQGSKTTPGGKCLITISAYIV